MIAVILTVGGDHHENILVNVKETPSVICQALFRFACLYWSIAASFSGENKMLLWVLMTFFFGAV